MKTKAVAACIGSVLAAMAFPALAQPEGSAGAEAQPDPMAGFYGNTLQIEVQDYKGLRFFEPDHSYRDRVRGKVVKGRWSIEDDHICTQSAGAARFCNLGLGKMAGETWVDHDPYTGNPVTFRLDAGRAADR